MRRNRKVGPAKSATSWLVISWAHWRWAWSSRLGIGWRHRKRFLLRNWATKSGYLPPAWSQSPSRVKPIRFFMTSFWGYRS